MFKNGSISQTIWDRETKRWIQEMSKETIEEKISRWQFEVDNQCFGYEETAKWIKIAKKVLREKSYKKKTSENSREEVTV